MNGRLLPYVFRVCLVSAIILSGLSLFAEVTGTVQGTVLDSSGAAVPNATVTLRNMDTGLVRTVKTNATGAYEFLSVPVGENYSVQVEAAGFQKNCANRRQARRQSEISRGLRTESRLHQRDGEVNANAAQVDTSNTQLGDVITTRR